MRTRRLVLALPVLVASLCAGVAPRAAAQDASPTASPRASADCTADLGVVRSAKACVAIVHASPDAPAVDIYLDGALAVTALEPNSATPFVELPAGDHLVQVVPTGGTVDQAILTVDPLTVEPARAYEVAVLGYVVEIEAAVFDVTSYAVPASGAGLPQTRVRIVHAVAGGKAIDAALIGDDVARPIADDLEFGTAGDDLEVPAGTYRLTVSTTWGDDLLDEPALVVPPDSVVTVYFVLGATGTTGMDALVVATAASRLPAPGATPGASPTA